MSKGGKCDLSADAVDGYPLLLSKGWFDKENAGRLRMHLRHSILRLFIDQAPDKDAPAVLDAIVEAENLLEIAHM